MRCTRCAHVKRERLAFLADNPFYTKRFAYYVGRRCRQATIKDVAEEFRLPCARRRSARASANSLAMAESPDNDCTAGEFARRWWAMLERASGMGA